MSEMNQSLRNGKVEFGNDFNSLSEVTALFGSTAMRLPYTVALRVQDKDNTIALLVSENGGGGWTNRPHYGTKHDSRGWREIVRIDEYNKDDAESKKRVEAELAEPLSRYVFWRMTHEGLSWYKFMGTFVIDREATAAEVAEGRYVCVYRRSDMTCECRKADVAVRDITGEEFGTYSGKTLECQLLTAVEFRSDDAKHAAGDVRLWPGMKLAVEEVAGDTLIARCDGLKTDARTHLDVEGPVKCLIPKRDLELGYLKVCDI